MDGAGNSEEFRATHELFLGTLERITKLERWIQAKRPYLKCQQLPPNTGSHSIRLRSTEPSSRTPQQSAWYEAPHQSNHSNRCSEKKRFLSFFNFFLCFTRPNRACPKTSTFQRPCIPTLDGLIATASVPTVALFAPTIKVATIQIVSNCKV